MPDQAVYANAYNRPQPREGPKVPYNNDSGSNPVLRGYSLAAVSTIIASSHYVQRIFWTLNRFEKLKELPYLEDYDARHDPTVVPVSTSAPSVPTLLDLPQSAPRASPTDYYTSADYRALYQSGKVTPSDVVESLLPLIQRDAQPPGQYSVGFISVRADLIRAAAKASTERYQQGKPLSPLDGVPVTIKDEVDLAGYKTTKGSVLDLTDKSGRTSWCVEKWQEAGAIILGKTNMHEVGLDTTNNNITYGTPLNPHNPGYYTGGSSGGSAFAVASGLVPIALGVDGGGSIRLPSSFCGVFGLKPSHGRVSSKAGYEMTNSVAVNGPIANSMDDLALAYRIMAQPDPSSSGSSQFPNSLLTSTDVAGSTPAKKILGLYKDWISRSDAVVLTAFNATVDHLVKVHGYETVDIEIPCIPQGQKAHAMTILSESRSVLTASQMKKLSYHNQLLLNIAGGHASAQDFLYAQRLRQLLMSHLAWLWTQYPGMLILTPTIPFAGWKIAKPTDITNGIGVSDSDMSLRSMEYVYLANFTGNPAISVPCGYSDENVPIGFMAMGDWGSEEQLLAFGKEAQSSLDNKGGIQRPKGDKAWFDLLAQHSS
ncbi:hypothetical protein PV10_01114 [Exophiala mesophila]|uniref:Amidase domain-containing protein n=1 Tax=Exophiala mesophila TaxID=212818 RepID=A0A0D1ZRX2_EXOME|nr:uncharacterized protein PV10_01114 [Exophiala mesophila]KIV97352.1 hypothetical protein PV10_01114 [Exophiala mesophila]